MNSKDFCSAGLARANAAAAPGTFPPSNQLHAPQIVQMQDAFHVSGRINHN
jgi:hypothetical protein